MRLLFAIPSLLFLAAFHGNAAEPDGPRTLRTLEEIETVASPEAGRFAINLEACVLYANPQQNHLFLTRDRSILELECNLNRVPSLRAGDLVRIEGDALLQSVGRRIRILPVPLINNDGLHVITEASGSLDLEPGVHRLRLEWFNGGGEGELSLEYKGPGFARQAIPAKRLTPLSGPGDSQAESGLAFRAYEERFWELPVSFNQARLTGEGITASIHAGLATAARNAALEFNAKLEVTQAGNYTFFLRSDDGSRLYLGPPSLAFTMLGTAPLPEPLRVTAGNPGEASGRSAWIEMEGEVTAISRENETWQLELSSDQGRSKVILRHRENLPTSILLGTTIRATGVGRVERSPEGKLVFGSLFVDRRDLWSPRTGESTPGISGPPEAGADALLRVRDIDELPEEELAKSPQVRLEGVVTCALPAPNAFLLHDGQRAIYVNLDPQLFSAEPGDHLLVHGYASKGNFSPFVQALSVQRLGLRQLPLPLQAGVKSLINGSLHCQYVELTGFVTRTEGQYLRLFMKDATLRILIEDRLPSELQRLENAIVRIRGSLFANWNPQLQQIDVGTITLNGTTLSVERNPSKDLSSVPSKTIDQLYEFDPFSGPFQRVRLPGTVLDARDGTLFLQQGNLGFRVQPLAFRTIPPGSEVDCIGFVDLSGPSPRLAEAHLLETRSGELPPPVDLKPGELLANNLDATRVRIEGVLVDSHLEKDSRILQIQSGSLIFQAHLPLGEVPFRIAKNAVIQVTGTYLARGGNRLLQDPVEGMEILLADVAAIQLVKSPPWWTMERLLGILAVLSLFLFLALLYIKLLRDQVRKRSRELRREIENRQAVEHARIIDEERSRLAQDLHDDLGAGLTEVMMLGDLATRPSAEEQKQKDSIFAISRKARELISRLDEIVWAVNPRYDSLASTWSYIASFAQRFLALASIQCRFDLEQDLPETGMETAVRHNLFLAVKESLNNIVRHAHASEVTLKVEVLGDGICLSITDDGRGLDPSDLTNTAGQDGLASIRKRITDIGGRCEIERVGPQGGTRTRINLPLS